MNINLIKISAIVPAFNCAETLERAVYSLINQTYPLAEIIIVNNNSTDDTQLVINKLVKNFPELIKSYLELNKGSNYARNTGIKVAKGSWLQLLDSDDELETSKISNQVDLINQNSQTDVVYSIAKYYVQNAEINKYLYFKKSRIDPDPIKGLIQSKLGRTSTNLWKKETMEKVCLFDTEYSSSQEYFLMLKLFKVNAHFSIDHQATTKMFLQKESISQTNDPDRALIILENKLIFGSKLRTLLSERNLLDQKYNRLINKRATQEFYSVFLIYHKKRDSLLQLKKEFRIQIPIHQILKIYIYHVHINYNIKLPFIKYIALPYLFLRHISKLKVN
jgi:glycosyltransferase involved in cell wall biosynthesis